MWAEETLYRTNQVFACTVFILKPVCLTSRVMLFVTEFWIRCIILHKVSKLQVYVYLTELMHILFNLLIRAISATLSFTFAVCNTHT